jgi:hypothetical protein
MTRKKLSTAPNTPRRMAHRAVQPFPRFAVTRRYSSKAFMGLRNTRLTLLVQGLLMVSPAVFAADAGSAADAAPPKVEFQAVAERDAVKRGSALKVLLLIANQSDTPLTQPSLVLRGFGFDGTMPPLKDVAGYGSETANVTLTAGEQVEFGQRRVVFLLEYSWTRNGKSGAAIQPATVTVQLNRQFEEEAKGLPGGTAALLYLLLPTMPAFLAYEFVDALRKGEGLKMPQFRTEYIVPAFLAAVLLSFLSLVGARADESFAYANPTRFAIILLVSCAAGALIPGWRWMVERRNWRQQAFRADDGFADYLAKVLLQSANGEVRWVTGTVGGQSLAGVLLQQPNGEPVLGARLQVSPVQGKSDWGELVKVVDAKGVVHDGAKLVQWVRANAVSVAFLANILKDEGTVADAKIVAGIEGFETKTSEPSTIVTAVN